jgi:DNA ligase-1
MEADLIQVQQRGALYLPEADLWLDPRFPVGRAFISHAHADHVAKHRQTFGSEVTGTLMRKRYGANKSGEFRAMAWREPLEMDGWRLEILPAGHIMGSAMLHLTRLCDGATLLYTGDYKLRQGLSSERCELKPADTLIMECTFGQPHFVFPPTSETMSQMIRFARETLEDGGIPVLLGYSLGKAQEILCALRDSGMPVMLHKSILEMTRAVPELLGELPEHRLFDAKEAKGHVLLFPPSAARSQVIRRLKICRTAMLSGWAMESGARYRYQVDEAFPLSDHADYPQLIETVETVRPKRIHPVHGPAQVFAADLRRRGWEAWTLDGADQLELAVDTAVPEAAVVTKASSPVPEYGPVDSFRRWASVCAKAAEESSRLSKVSVLAQYLAELTSADDLKAAVRFCAAKTGSPADRRRPLQTGWAIVRQVLQELGGLTNAEYRILSRTQNDAGRTAFLALSRGELGATEEVTLAKTAAFFSSLREADGPMVRASLLREMLKQMTASEGSWLVRLLTGDLRMGSKEGLVEEAIAEAFRQSPAEVRHAAMLTGDLGEAAIRAREGRLEEARPALFVPLKVMLASPEEKASAIWERLANGDDSEVWLEDKYDGIRAQLHAGPGGCEIYSRDLKPTGDQFPEIVGAFDGQDDEVILDGEIIAFADEKRLSFFDLQKRLGRRDQADLFLPSEITVRYVVFDLLVHTGRSLLEQPLVERRKALESLALPEGVVLIDAHSAGSADEIEEAFLAARHRGNEGLIAKDRTSVYSPGRRGKAWLKLKKAFSTLDVVVVKAEQGHGKRSHVLSDYTFAVRDSSTDELKVIGKAYSGLTDLEIEELTEHFTRQTLSRRGRVRTVVPDTVLEIAFDSIQPSKRHNSGLALRFPRIKAIRRDKTPDDIDTLTHARRLAGVDQGDGA